MVVVNGKKSTWLDVKSGVQCLSQELKKVRHMSHQAEKGETHIDIKCYFEASKPVCMVAMQVCMVAMHYQLPFMISKCLLQSPSLTEQLFRKWANSPTRLPKVGQ